MLKNKKIGILGGGQLARMMVLETKKLGFEFVVLDPGPNCPAAQVGAEQVVGSFKDEQDIYELCQQVDLITFDIEHINIASLKKLEKIGLKIFPNPQILELIQDKLLQKQTLRQAGLPVSRFMSVADIEQAISSFGFPFVQKKRFGGYDGKGVLLLRDKSDLKKAFSQDFYIEEFVDIEKEIAVLVAKNLSGDISVYPVVEMIFEERANICDLVICPARVDPQLASKARKLAIQSISALGERAIGIFAIEMFVTKDKRLLVNEIAPRPHNAGHFTLNGCMTSQFEQHIRAVTGLPLGSTDLLLPTVMLNILGQGTGTPQVKGLDKALAIPGVHVHFYGKKEVRPFRKMGHVNITAHDLEEALDKAHQVRQVLHVVGIEA
ncbi:MAG: 5-(carboxyamino)imidazole ribonucleotide synthase [Desulfonauticus sp.]|nr:5-(carboxyamino)imidazole ribonucleotide synthase [Desulfonauticus sp.]